MFIRNYFKKQTYKRISDFAYGYVLYLIMLYEAYNVRIVLKLLYTCSAKSLSFLTIAIDVYISTNDLGWYFFRLLSKKGHHFQSEYVHQELISLSEVLEYLKSYLN